MQGLKLVIKEKYYACTPTLTRKQLELSPNLI